MSLKSFSDLLNPADFPTLTTTTTAMFKKTTLSPSGFLQILPSPTAGSCPFNWKINSDKKLKESIKQEEEPDSDISFQPITTFKSLTSTTLKEEHVGIFQESTNEDSFSSAKITAVEAKCRLELEDGFSWRKYGQKIVKGSKNLRSYYKCTHPNCAIKKIVERTMNGQIIGIVYKEKHNHPKPYYAKRSLPSSLSSSSSLLELHNPTMDDEPEIFNTSPENSCISIEDEDFDLQMCKKKEIELEDEDEDEPEAKRWRSESEAEEGIRNMRDVRDARVMIKTISDVDVLEDGYRWRKYGQKVVKGNPNPRSYYKCTHPGCPVRKKIGRSSEEPEAVITTYEFRHNHALSTLNI